MVRLSNEQMLQEEQYKFPYHFIPTYINGNFRQFVFLRWGYEYMSYTNFVISFLKKENFSNHIDIGCGDGRFILEAQSVLKNTRMTGVDYSEHAIRLASIMNPKGEYICGDIGSVLSQKYDAATLIEVLEHIPQTSIDDFVTSIANTLTARGKLIITVPSTNMKLNPKHFQHFDRVKIENALNGVFKIIDFKYLNSASWLTRFIESFFVNRFFILKQRHLVNFLYKIYLKKCLLSNPKSGKRLFVVCEKL